MPKTLILAQDQQLPLCKGAGVRPNKEDFMKTNILALSVLLAMGTANPIATTTIYSRDFASTAAPKPAEAAKSETPEEKKAREEREAAAAKKKAEDEARAKAEADAKKAAAKSNVVDDNGTTFIDRGNGEVEAYVGCGTTAGCQRYSLKVNGLEDLAKVRDALEAKKKEEAEKVKKPVVAEFDAAAHEKELKRSFEADVLEACDYDVVESSSRSRERRRYRDDEDFDSVSAREQQLLTGISGTAFSGVSIPSADDRAECAAEAMAEKLSSIEEDLEKDLSEFGVEDADLRKVDDGIRELKRKLSKETDAKKKASLEASIAKLEIIEKKISAAQKVSRDFYRSQVSKRVVGDLSARAGAGKNYLHELTATTPEIFRGLRRDTSKSLLDVYRRQAQLYTAFTAAATRTQDPAQKLIYQREALKYGNLATNFNAYNIGGCTYAINVDPANANCISPSQHTMAGLARENGLSQTDVLSAFRSTYNPGAHQIMTALNQFYAGKDPNQVSNLLLDGSTVLTPGATVPGQNVQYTGRGARNRSNLTRGGTTIQPGVVQQPGIIQPTVIQPGIVQQPGVIPGAVNPVGTTGTRVILRR